MDKLDLIINNLKKDVNLLKETTKPKIIFIGGIPGSGKSLLIKKAQHDFSNEEFTIIEADLYRKYFKNAKSVEETVDDANKIELELLLYSLKKRKNIIHISTLRAYETINKLINDYIHPLSYEIYLYILINNKIDSSISTYERYINAKFNNEPFPRINKVEYLNLANEGFESAIKFFSKKNYFQSIHLFKRGKNMGLPTEIKILPNGNIKDTIKKEEEKQIKKLNYVKIQKRVINIQQNLFLNSEKEEFNKVLKDIIYNK